MAIPGSAGPPSFAPRRPHSAGIGSPVPAATILPEEALRAWPAEIPVEACWCGDPAANDKPDLQRRYTLLARPTHTFVSSVGEAGTRSGWYSTDGAPVEPPVSFTHEPLTDLDLLLNHDWPNRIPSRDGYEHPLCRGGWMGAFSYDLGGLIEPASEPVGNGSDTGVALPIDTPLIVLHRLGAVSAFDHMTGTWSGADLPRSPARSSVPNSVMWSQPDAAGAAEFAAAVERAVEYIRAGDVFQVNLSRRFEIASVSASARGIFESLMQRVRPRHGSLISIPGGHVISASPELFLSIDSASRRIVTRPMKGTRSIQADPGELAASPKDRAELAMIVDLMRNDLGRVCEIGSVRVAEARSIEQHAGMSAGVWQAVATVEGRLRADARFAHVLRATFPPGSVTGAPKIRAMQIIRELESAQAGYRRGFYCGCAGWIADTGDAQLGVTIRAILESAGVFAVCAGAGIVADSNPAAEWDEVLIKRRTIVPDGPLIAATGER